MNYYNKINMGKEKYRIIYRNTYYGDEEIDTAETKVEAICLTGEYRKSFRSNNVYFKRI